MLITLSRRNAICQSVAKVQLTGVAPLGAVSHRFNFFKIKFNYYSLQMLGVGYSFPIHFLHSTLVLFIILYQPFFLFIRIVPFYNTVSPLNCRHPFVLFFTLSFMICFTLLPFDIRYASLNHFCYLSPNDVFSISASSQFLSFPGQSPL